MANSFDTENEEAQELEPIPAEKLKNISYCVAIYLADFKEPPFGEMWSVNGLESRGLLCNPTTTADFATRLYLYMNENPECEIDDETVRVPKELIQEHIENTLASPVTNILAGEDENWITKQDLEILRDLLSNLEEDTAETVDITMPYSLKKIFHSYNSAIENSFSLALLGYQELDKTGKIKSGKLKKIKLSSKTKLPKNILPRALGRVITLNYPGEEVVDVKNVAIAEIGGYLSTEQRADLEANIGSTEFTTFMGEVAKIPPNYEDIEATRASAAEYFKILLSKSFPPKLPDRLFYFTLKGTEIAKSRSGATLLLLSINRLARTLGIKYQERFLNYKTPYGDLIIGIIERTNNKD